MKKLILFIGICVISQLAFSQDSLKVVEDVPEQKWSPATVAATKLITIAILDKIRVHKNGVSPNPVKFVITSIAINIGKGGKVNGVYFPKNIPEKMAKWYETVSIANEIKGIKPFKLARFENKTLLYTVIFTNDDSESNVPRRTLMNNMPIIWPDFIVENETEVIVLKPQVLTMGTMHVDHH